MEDQDSNPSLVLTVMPGVHEMQPFYQLIGKSVIRQQCQRCLPKAVCWLKGLLREGAFTPGQIARGGPTGIHSSAVERVLLSSIKCAFG